LSDGGRLDIALQRVDKDFVSVTFTDNGCGIPETDIKRVFEPFFTSRAKEGGTGLGLSITYGLVQEIGGSISVKSQVGKGTSFIITLPLRMKQKRGDTDASITGRR
jgi:two-component system NtrC family sensor kinase